MTNPEAAAPTDMEAALRDARRIVNNTMQWTDYTLRLARCLLASSAEVAALCEQVARLQPAATAWQAHVSRCTCRDRWEILDANSGCPLHAPEATIRADERARVVRALRHRAEEMGEDHAMSEVEEAFSGTPLAVSAALDFAAKWIAFHLADPGALPKSGAAPKMTGAEFLAEVRAHRDVFTPESIREVIDGLREFRDDDHESGAADEREGYVICGARDGRYDCQLEPGHDGNHVCPEDNLSEPVHEWPRGLRCIFSRDGDRCYLDASHGGPCIFNVLSRAAAPSGEPVERDPDDDSAWPLPEGQWALINSREWCVVHTNGDTTFCYGGTGILSGRVTPLHPSTEPTIRARNLAARAARTKAAAPKDASHG